MSQRKTAFPSKLVRFGKRRRWRWRIPRMRLRYLCLLAVCGWAGYVYFFVQAPVVKRLANEENQLTQQVQSATASNKQLTEQIHELSSNDYIARLARKNYDLVKPGDIIYQPGQ